MSFSIKSIDSLPSWYTVSPYPSYTTWYILPTGRQIGKDFDGFDLYDNTNGIEKDFGEIKDINDKKYTQNDKDDISINTTVWALYYDEQWYKAKVLKVQYYEAGNIYHVVYEGYGDTVYQLGRESIDLIENDIKN